jgi:predicted house-cleaning noncanonical NTP pyrophosphatase (MazG superfamily)
MIPKLVRDKVPERIRAEGRVPVVRQLDPTNQGEVTFWLRAKLREEIHEYLKDRDPLELIDVITVARRLWTAHGRSADEFVTLVAQKLHEVGDFTDLIVLEDIESCPPSS